MTLDDILGRITPNEDGKTSYSSENFLKASRGIETLGKIDLSTTGGLEKYLELTGDNPEYSIKKLNLRKNIREEEGEKDLENYANENFRYLVGEIDKNTLLGMAFKYCPKNDVGSIEFDKIRKVLHDTQEGLTTIQNNPKEYLKQEIEKEESSYMKKCLAKYPEEILKIDQGELQQKAISVILNHGAENYLLNLKENLSIQEKEFSKKYIEIQREQETKLENARNKFGVLSATDEVELISPEQKKIKSLSEKYSDVRLLRPLVQEISSLAIGAIEQRLKDEADKK